MAMQKEQVRSPCMVFLMAFLIVSTMNAIPAEAGRMLVAKTYGALDPRSQPFSAGPGMPYIHPRGCTKIYGCPPAGAKP
ncbi:hypothetical protein ACP70R_019672 [Stipagrostis hirtigluma subsp. patula]